MTVYKGCVASGSIVCMTNQGMKSHAEPTFNKNTSKLH